MNGTQEAYLHRGQPGTESVDGARSIPRILVYRLAATADHVPAAVRWTYLLFMFTIPFEAADLSFTSSEFSLSRLTGLMFFSVYFYYYLPLPTRQRSFPGISWAMGCFLVYLALYVSSGIFLRPKLLPQFYSQLFTFLQLLIFFWISSDLLTNEKLARQAILAYASATVLLALGTSLHLPGFSSQPGANLERSTALGENPNTIGMLLALGAVAVVGLRLNPVYTHPCSTFGLLLMLLPLLTAMVQTGSRAGMGALLIGLMVYIVPFWHSRRRSIAILLALLGIGATVYITLQDPLASSRWRETLYERNLAGREEIFPTAMHMIAERPLMGWRPVAFQHELGKRLGTDTRDAHNLLLHLWLEGGTIGALPFVLGLAFCAHAAWRARTGTLGLLPLALFMTTLAANMSHTYLARKPLWLVLALTLAGGISATRTQKRRVGMRIGQQLTKATV